MESATRGWPHRNLCLLPSDSDDVHMKTQRCGVGKESGNGVNRKQVQGARIPGWIILRIVVQEIRQGGLRIKAGCEGIRDWPSGQIQNGTVDGPIKSQIPAETVTGLDDFRLDLNLGRVGGSEPYSVKCVGQQKFLAVVVLTSGITTKLVVLLFPLGIAHGERDRRCAVPVIHDLSIFQSVGFDKTLRIGSRRQVDDPVPLRLEGNSQVRRPRRGPGTCGGSKGITRSHTQNTDHDDQEWY